MHIEEAMEEFANGKLAIQFDVTNVNEQVMDALNSAIVIKASDWFNNGTMRIRTIMDYINTYHKENGDRYGQLVAVPSPFNRTQLDSWNSPSIKSSFDDFKLANDWEIEMGEDSIDKELKELLEVI